MSTNGLKFAGDVEISELLLISLNGQAANVLNQVVTLEIHEDILSPFMSLSLVLRESQDFMNLFPFIGEEYLQLKVKTPDIAQIISGKFYVYKMSDRTYTKEREVMYTIKAISQEFLTESNVKLSKPISGNIGESALRLLGSEGLNTSKAKNIDATLNKTKFIANFWSPVQCLSMLTTSAISVYGSPSYMFYENRQGFNFKSINNLLRQSTYQTFTKDNYSRKESSFDTSSTKDPAEDYKRIMSIDIPVVTDYIEDIQSGQLKSRLVSYDIVTKKYTVKDYSIKKDPGSFVLLNKSLPYSKYSISNAASTMINMPKYYNNFDTYSDVTNSSTIQKRLSFFKNLEKHKIEIEVLGRVDYTIGQIVELKLPRISQITKDDTDPYDKMLSGRYLITALTHYISRNEHTCKMEIVKNSVMFDLEKV